MSQQYGVEAFVQEHHVFWMLVKRHKRHDVGHVYLAIQAAIGLGMPYVNVGAMIGFMMPEERGMMGSYCPNIGSEGLAFFSWLYEFELVEKGGTDYHHYVFRRRYDGRSVTAYLKTTCDVGKPSAEAAFERMRSRLGKQREAIMVKHRWVTLVEAFREVFPDAMVVELKAPPLNSKGQQQIRRGQLEAQARAVAKHLRKLRAELRSMPPDG